MAKYHKLDHQTDSEHGGLHEIDLEMASIHLGDQDGGSEVDGLGYFSIRVLHKEKVYDVSGIEPKTTVLQLKEKIAIVSEIPVTEQRLITAGKLLRPEDKDIGSFNIIAGSNVHLFPKPPGANVAAPGSTTSDGGNANSNTTSSTINLGLYSYEVIQSSREIRSWSSILVFLSMITLVNNLSYFAASGKFGTSLVDSCVNVADTLCSVAGVIVGNKGMEAAANIDPIVITDYVKYLTVLAICSVSMRIAWVIDIYIEVKKAVHQSQMKTQPPTEVEDNPDFMDDLYGTARSGSKPLSESLISSIAIQALLIALLCIGAWANCVTRAYLFRNSVHSHQISSKFTLLDFHFNLF